MTPRAKIFVGLLGAILACGVVALVQERRQVAILDAVRGSLATGDSQEKVVQVLTQHGLRADVAKDGRSYTAHVWFHIRPDVSVTVTIDEHGKVGGLLVESID